MTTDDRRKLQDWMARLADGDREAFRPAFALLWPELRRFVARHVAPTDADDVAQQALLSLFARAAEFDARRDALAFALGIAAWEIRTHRTRLRRRRETGDAPLAALADGGASPEEEMLTRDLAAHFEGAIGALDPADAETIAAAREGRRPAGVAPATFRKRLSRAVARLSAVWRTRHGNG